MTLSRRILIRWVPLAALATALSLMVYVAVQQVGRQIANDPQVQIARDAQAAIAAGVPEQLGLRRRIEGVKNTRTIGKADMVHNSGTPQLEVDSQTYEVRADGELLTCEPASVLPMAQRYFLF